MSVMTRETITIRAKREARTAIMMAAGLIYAGGGGVVAPGALVDGLAHFAGDRFLLPWFDAIQVIPFCGMGGMKFRVAKLK